MGGQRYNTDFLGFYKYKLENFPYWQLHKCVNASIYKCVPTCSLDLAARQCGQPTIEYTTILPFIVLATLSQPCAWQDWGISLLLYTRCAGLSTRQSVRTLLLYQCSSELSYADSRWGNPAGETVAYLSLLLSSIAFVFSPVHCQVRLVI